MNKFKALFLIVVLSAISLVFGDKINQFFVLSANEIATKFYETKDYFTNFINNHLNQTATIKALRKENAELRKSGVLLGTFAHELDQILSDKNSSKFEPDVKLVRAISYVKPHDYNKFWIKFDGFNPDKIYGLIKDGYTIGIVSQENGLPRAILQHDEKSLISVYVGKDKIPGYATGDGENLIVKFIPSHLVPKIGDEVFTSGLDDIFFAGIGVGVVTKVVDENLYKSAVIAPKTSVNLPAFLYVITKDK